MSAEHRRAIFEEQTVSRTAEVRQLLLASLARAGLTDPQSFGWAIFTQEAEPIDDDLERGRREILLLQDPLSAPIQAEHTPPNLRLIVNERQQCLGNLAIVTEDISISQIDPPRYMMSVAIDDEYGQATHSYWHTAPIFQIQSDYRIRISNNLSYSIPPEVGVRVHQHRVKPFGVGDNLADMNYALDRARTLLGEIADLQPEAIGRG